MTLKGKKILLGITGSISAYKSILLVRELIKLEAEVQVIMTESASNFVSKLTLSTLSKKPVYTDFYNSQTGEWANHVQLALWADLILIVPATANTIAKLASGISDNLLLTVIYSSRCKVILAPAMDADMYIHPSFKKNVSILESFGYQVLESEKGELASGLIGEGRLMEIEKILPIIIQHFNPNLPLKGKKVVLTAGPTQEAIDPVRYISNHSTGKMGYALAQTCLNYGAEVKIISGPVNLKLSHPKLEIISVSSADEMLEATEKHSNETDLMFFTAAVADYKVKNQATQKIKKQDDEEDFKIELVKNPDIAKTIASKKQAHQIMVGFALETHNEKEYATQKLHKKNLDLVVLNSASEQGAGFKHDTNKVTLISHNIIEEYPLLSKNETANKIVDFVIDKLIKK